MRAAPKPPIPPRFFHHHPIALPACLGNISALRVLATKLQSGFDHRELDANITGFYFFCSIAAIRIMATAFKQSAIAREPIEFGGYPSLVSLYTLSRCGSVDVIPPEKKPQRIDLIPIEVFDH
jgi:hypothetical protein